VFVSDFGKIKDKYKQVLTNYGIDWEDEKRSFNFKCRCSYESPGIPCHKKLVEKEFL
jgi:UDP-N-acetylmuramoylalanine--D-glutamate ligase